MKDFIKSVSATIVGLLAFSVIVGVICLMSLVGMIASSQSTQRVADNSVLVIKLDGALQERAEDNLYATLSGTSTKGLQETLEAITKAKNNDEVKGIYLEAGSYGADMAQMQELRDALADFKTAKKWIVAYGEEYSLGAYYVASVADKIYLNPQGTISWQGMGGQMMLVKDALAKIGWPEGRIILSECAIYLANSPKSNTAYMAIDSALEAVRNTGDLPVPLHLRNAPTKLMADMGYHQGYKYAHDFANHYARQQYLPDGLVGRKYYVPSDNGYEKTVKEIRKRKGKK